MSISARKGIQYVVYSEAHLRTEGLACAEYFVVGCFDAPLTATIAGSLGRGQEAADISVIGLKQLISAA